MPNNKLMIMIVYLTGVVARHGSITFVPIIIIKLQLHKSNKL